MKCTIHMVSNALLYHRFSDALSLGHMVCSSFLYYRVSHAFSWKFMKPHIHPIIQEVIFPLMCHSDSDQELWETDPLEYIRLKYGMFEFWGYLG